MISFSTIIGFSSVSALFIYAIVSNTETYSIFVDLPSLAFVTGGTMAAGFIGYGVWMTIKSVFKIILIIVPDKNTDKNLRKLIKQLVEWNKVYRSKGVSALEQEVRVSKYTLLGLGFELLFNGYKEDSIHQILVRKAQTREEETETHVNILLSLSSFAPAFGMIGTVIGLVIMLSQFGKDLSVLGSGLSLALLTTLYGVMLAQMFFKPAAIQLNSRLTQIEKRHKIIITAFEQILSKQPSSIMQDKLNSILLKESN